MAKVKISEYSATPSSNTDIDNIDINEGCSPSGINNAIRALMSHLKNWQGGTSGDTLPVASGGTGSSTASAARTALGAANIPASGMAKSDGSTLSAGTAGTDYVAPATATTFTAKQTFTGSASTLSSKFNNALENITISATVATGTINYDVTTQSVLYYTANASANWTVNLRGNSTTTLNSLMATGEAITVVFLNTNGTTGYFNNVIQVDGTTVTPKWQNGSAPTNAVGSLGTITAGTGYTNGTYTNVSMSPVSGATFTTYPTVNVTVAGGVVTAVTLVSSGSGASSTAATTLTVAASLIGGTGSGFSIPVATFTSSGNASSIDSYSYTIVKTGSAAFTVFASLVQFK